MDGWGLPPHELVAVPCDGANATLPGGGCAPPAPSQRGAGPAPPFGRAGGEDRQAGGSPPYPVSFIQFAQVGEDKGFSLQLMRVTWEVL